MLKELWKFITLLGISDKLSPFDEKAIKLMNQLSFVMMIWFSGFTIIGLFNPIPIQLFILVLNVVLFGGVLLINSYGKTTLSKNYFILFGMAMVTFVNLVYDPSTFPIVQFITTAIFPVLIFRKPKTAIVYMGLNMVLLFFVLWYHRHYPPMLPASLEAAGTNPYVGVAIIMVVVFLISLFFRNVGEDLERRLVEKNRYLNDLIEKTQSMQEQMISSEKMASLGQLTAGIAHEINNPINFVSSNINPLKRDLTEMKELCIRYKNLHQEENPEEALKEIEAYTQKIDPEFLYGEIDTLIGGIEEGAARTKQIVMGLRNFSRMDEDEFKLADVHEGIESSLMLLRNKIKNRIEVVKEFGDIPEIECIPGKLNQVLMNILNNAAEAIGEKGVIIVSTSLNQKKNKVMVSIRDDGPGMPHAVKNRIFEPFYTTKAIGKGTGLGLAISYGIIEKHQGSIEVNSEVGQGSEFILTLPVKQPTKSF